MHITVEVHIKVVHSDGERTEVHKARSALVGDNPLFLQRNVKPVLSNVASDVLAMLPGGP